MIKYEAVNWESLEFIKAHLYRRLVEPLNKMLQTFAAVQQIDDKSTPAEKMIASQQTAAAILNVINAWSTLISYRRLGFVNDTELKLINKDSVPTWLTAQLAQQTSLRLDFTRSVRIHPETFWEGLIMLQEVAAYISQVAYIQIADALPPKQGIYLRVIFSSKADKPTFNSLEEIITVLDTDKPNERDLAARLLIARDMMRLNKAKFNLQNNKKTGQQAFSVYFEAHDTSAEPTDHERQETPTPTAPTPPTLPPVRESVTTSAVSEPTIPLKTTPASEDDSTIIEVAAANPVVPPSSEEKQVSTESDASPTRPTLSSQR